MWYCDYVVKEVAENLNDLSNLIISYKIDDFM